MTTRHLPPRTELARSAVDYIFEAIDSEDSFEINSALEHAAHYGDDAIPHLQAALTALEEDAWRYVSPPAVWEAVATTLVAIGTDAARTAAVETVVRAASTDEPFASAAAVAGLGQCDGANLAPLLQGAYRDATSDDVREAISNALFQIRADDPASLDVLHDFAPRRPAVGCRLAAVAGGTGAVQAVLDGFDALPDTDDPEAPFLDHVLDVLRALDIAGGTLDPTRLARASALLDLLRRRDELDVERADRDRRKLIDAVGTERRPLRLLSPRPTPPRKTPRSERPGPNSPCACGSGKKSKRCCGG